jgi:hypothetical protein
MHAANMMSTSLAKNTFNYRHKLSLIRLKEKKPQLYAMSEHVATCKLLKELALLKNILFLQLP